MSVRNTTGSDLSIMLSLLMYALCSYKVCNFSPLIDKWLTPSTWIV